MFELFGGIRRTFARLQRYRHIMAVLIKYGFEELAGLVGRHLKVGFGAKGISLTKREEIAKASLGDGRAWADIHQAGSASQHPP